MEKIQPIGRLTLANIRIAFPAIYAPEQFQGTGPFRCGAQLLVPKGSPQAARIPGIIESVAKEAWGTKFPALFADAKAKDNIAWRDGDRKAYDGYAGNFYISANCAGNEKAELAAKPSVYNRDKTDWEPGDKRVYAGCFIDASIEFYAMNKGFGPQVNCTLRGVRFWADGDAFSASTAKPDDFADVEEGADAGDFA